MSYSFYKDSLLEDKLAILSIGYVRAEVFLNISVHVIVDPDDFVVSDLGQVLDARGLTCGGRAFKDDSKVAYCDHTGELSQEPLEGRSQDEVQRVEVLGRTITF